MAKPRLLDLFCGAGGAAMGYSRAGFDVVGFDNRPQPSYPFEFHQGDAMVVLAEMASGRRDVPYDAIHASPPCQAYGSLAAMNRARGYVSKHYKFVAATRYFLDAIGLPYIIENVPGSDVRRDVTLCGSMFNLRVIRHRYFESNRYLMRLACHHYGHDFVGVYGDHAESGNVGIDGFNRKPRASTIDEARDAMGIDWMVWNEIKESIPPAYTEYLGHQLLQHIEVAA